MKNTYTEQMEDLARVEALAQRTAGMLDKNNVHQQHRVGVRVRQALHLLELALEEVDPDAQG